jgi:hypothetical protein
VKRFKTWWLPRWQPPWKSFVLFMSDRDACPGISCSD